MNKDKYVGMYLERHLKGCKLDYGMEYLSLRDELIDKAEKKWKRVVRRYGTAKPKGN